MPENIRPVFIISLPRSGSTLLQRLIATHPEVSTVSEPWILLPLVAMYTDIESYSEYGEKLTAMAIEDFIEELPDKEEDLRRGIRRFVLELFGKVSSGDSTFFLEKTPRNTLIIKELMAIFPEGKFIFLWRNPVSIVSSMMETFSKGRWRLHSNYVDLFKGYQAMCSAFEEFDDRILSIRYEDMVTSEEAIVERLEKYLGLNIANHLNKLSKMNLKGSLGDKSGIEEYKEVSPKSIEKWRSNICNIYRKVWVINYLKWIGRERLGRAGYDYDNIVAEVRNIKVGWRFFFSDVARSGYGFFRRVLVIDILKKHIVGFTKGKRQYLVN